MERWPQIRMAVLVLGISLVSLLTAIFVSEGRALSIPVTLIGHAELAFLGYRYKQFRDGQLRRAQEKHES